MKGEPPILKNIMDCCEHAMTELVREEFDREVEKWTDEGLAYRGS